MRNFGPALAMLALFAATACSPRQVNEEPVLQNGDRVRSVDASTNADAQRTRAEQAATAAERDSLAAEALSGCEPAVCEAIARGEVAIGMTEPQVLAATRTTDDAWSIRRSGSAGVLVPSNTSTAPQDAVAELAMVQLRDGRVNAYSYREATGVRLVASPEDATTAGRAASLADQLIRQGDDLVAAGDLEAALDRYDRADVLGASDPMLDYRIASVLDKQLRPIEALIRYQLFLHRLEIEKIEARGDAAAKLAEAIALAQQRIIVLERQTQ